MPNEPKPPKPDFPAHLLTQMLDLQPDIERVLADEPRSSRRFSANLEDKVQTVLLRVLRHLPGYRPHKDGLKPWVTRIARNYKHDARRSNERREATFGSNPIDADFAPSPSVSPERAAQLNGLLAKVFHAIDDMPSELQEVLLLSVFGEMTHAEIADKLGITKDAVKMRLSRARQHIRESVGRIDDHIGVMPLISSTLRGMMTVFGRVVHLWPPIVVGLFAIPHFESIATVLEPEKSAIVAVTNIPMPAPAIESPSNTEHVAETTITPAPVPPPRKSRQSKRMVKFDVELPAAAYLMNDRR